MRILAVDDSAIARALIPKLFRAPEFPPPVVTDSALACLDQLNHPEAAFDCLILDIEMPGMDGIELCGRIRQMPAHRDTPIIMLTAREEAESIENAFAHGANDYIVKRFDVKEFTSRVRVAERLLNKLHASYRLDPSEVPADARRGQHQFALSEPLLVPTIDRLILPFSLGNYLTQLPRTAIDDSRVFAVGIDEIEAHYAALTSKEFAQLLQTVSEALMHVIASPRVLMAYLGNGKLMCVTRDTDLPRWPEIEDAVLDRIGETSAPGQISISMGNPIAPFANRTQRVRKTFDRALARVDARQALKDGVA